jgi:hypothetical protein
MKRLMASPHPFCSSANAFCVALCMSLQARSLDSRTRCSSAEPCPFRKPYPEIDLDYTRFKFPVLAFKFPVPLQKFPVPMSREFCSKSAKSLRVSGRLSRDLA